MTALLDIAGLEVRFGLGAPVLKGLDLTVHAGETVALVGESGSGKTMTALAAMRLLPRGASVTAGAVRFRGEDVLAMPARRLNRFRGGEAAMIFQQPLAMLDPTATVGSQVAEAVELHTGLSGAAAQARVLSLLREVGIPAPEQRARAYAHQLSGGMAQRVMIAAALAGDPKLLIADEPTTALDVTVQLQILHLLARERRHRGLGILLITHDLGVVAALADRAIVLYAGEVVEEGTTEELLHRPRHPYTRALVRASLLRDEADGRLFALAGGNHPVTGGCHFLPRCPTAEDQGLHAHCARHAPRLDVTADGHRVRCCAPGVEVLPEMSVAPPRRRTPAAAEPALTIRGLAKHYAIDARRVVRSVDGVDLDVAEGEVVGLVGESGCGKSTLARLLLRITAPTGGHIVALGQDHGAMDRAALRDYRRDVQLVFQDPFAALDPRMRLGDSLRAPLDQNGIGTPAEREELVRAMLREVGLSDELLGRRPGECSGGQLQRAVIARALLLGPRILVCDEPTSALDASIRAQILNLLEDLRRTRGLTMLMISHDLRVMRRLADRIAVMYLGEIVEVAETEALFQAPAHPYTRALLAAALPGETALDEDHFAVRGEPPSPLAPPPGCRFAPRCPAASVQCTRSHPPLEPRAAGGEVRCWHPLGISASARR